MQSKGEPPVASSGGIISDGGVASGVGEVSGVGGVSGVGVVSDGGLVKLLGVVMSDGVNAVLFSRRRSLGRVVLALSHQYSSAMSV